MISIHIGFSQISFDWRDNPSYGRTIAETLEIAKDVAKKLIEAREEQIPVSNRYTTVPNHTGDMPEGTLRAILNQAAIEVEDFIKLK